MPTAKDVDANRGWMPSKSLYWHTFGSLTNALREAGFDVAGGGGAPRARDRAGRGDGAAARAPAEVQRLGGCAPGRPVAADRVAGLPDVRRAARGVVDVPVPRARSGCARRAWRSAATAAWAPARTAGRAYAAAMTASRSRQKAPSSRRAHGRQRVRLVRRIGHEVLDPHDAGASERDELAFVQPPLAEAQTRVVLGDLERLAGRGEEELTAGGADPERAADAAREDRAAPARARRASRSRASRGTPRSREPCRRSPRRARRSTSESTRHLRLRALEAVARHELVVVVDVPVVDPDDGAVADRMVVGVDRAGGPSCSRARGASTWRRVGRESRSARARALAPLRCLCTTIGGAGRAVRVPDGIGAALGDRRRAAPGRRASGRPRSTGPRLYPAMPHMRSSS